MKGLWYDHKRERWRVRVYHYSAVIHLSYHYEYETALRAWRAACWRARERKLRERHREQGMTGVMDQISYLASN